MTRACAAVSTDVFDAQIEPIEAVEVGQLEQRDQLIADILSGFLADIGHRGDRRRLGAEGQLGVERRVAQRRVDHPGLAQQAQILVGQDRQRLAVRHKVIARPPPGEEQTEHLAIDEPFARQLGGIPRRRVQDLRRFVVVGAEPDPQRFRHPDHLAVAGHRGERRRVQIGRDDFLAPAQRVAAAHIGARRRCQHLTHLLADPARQAAWRVAKFLDLGGKRAAAALIELRSHDTSDPSSHRQSQALPFDCGIALRGTRVEQMAILDEAQGLRDYGRHAGKV